MALGVVVLQRLWMTNKVDDELRLRQELHYYMAKKRCSEATRQELRYILDGTMCIDCGKKRALSPVEVPEPWCTECAEKH